MSACIKRKSDGQILSSCSKQSVSNSTELASLHNFVTSRGLSLDDYEFLDIDKTTLHAMIKTQDDNNRPTSKKRRNEYPPIGDQLDALWKGGDDAAAMKVIIDKVKSDNPK